MHLSEEDIRTKIVYEWLKLCSVSLNDMRIEHTIKLNVGRGQKLINSRADLLVKSSEGQNLLIIEVKKPSHKLTQGDEIQARSYARSLEGDIAPFTILTNGTESRIFDSVTGNLIDGNNVPNDHPYVKAGFKVTGDGIRARMEALEYLISLSSDNLLEFCKNQVEYRMRKLKGENATSQKKYISDFCVYRIEQRKTLDKKLFPERSNKAENLVLVVGSPQHGKTCFMCQTVENYLEEGIPVLFFPAISLSNGLLNAMQEDLAWCFYENDSEYSWVSRLNRSVKKLNKKVVIFIDGWNEMAENALRLNEECERLNLDHIAIVLSTTSPTVKNLLQDKRGNPGYVAEAIRISSPLIKQLSIRQLNNAAGMSVVQIGKFSDEEAKLALTKYSDYYNVVFPQEDEILREPFYLRMASEFLRDNPTETNLIQSTLVRNCLLRKGTVSGLREIQAIKILKELAGVFYKKGRPLPIFDFPDAYQNDFLLDQLQEGAIVLLTGSEAEPMLDFYSSNELNFSVAYLLKGWDKVIINPDFDEKAIEQLALSAKGSVGNDALVWFFGLIENAHLIELVLTKIPFKNWFTNKLGQLLINAIADHTSRKTSINLAWLYLYMENYLDVDLEQNEYASSIIYSYLDSGTLKPDQEEFWIRNLLRSEKIEDIGIEETYIYEFYGEIESMDWEGDTSLDVDLFERFLFEDDYILAKRASFYLAYACPYLYLRLVPKLASKYRENLESLQEILEFSCPQILSKMSESYYGSMCPGWFSYAVEGDEEIKEEFWSQKNRWFPIMRLLKPNSDLFNRIHEILKDLKEFGLVEDDLSIDNNPNQTDLF